MSEFIFEKFQPKNIIFHENYIIYPKISDGDPRI